MNIDPLAEDYYSFSTYNYTLNNPIFFVDPDGRGVYDWYQNQTGRVVWFDNTDENFTSENGDQWENVGSNLEEVEENLNVPEDQNVEWNTMEAVALGGSKGDGKGALGVTILENVAQISFDLNIENAGDFNQERIDGETEITGVNVNITLSTETLAPGVQLQSVGGNFGLEKWTPTGKNSVNNSDSFQYAGPMLSSKDSHASGKATSTISLSKFRSVTRQGLSFSIGVNSTAVFKLQQTGKTGVFDTSNTIKLK